MPFCTSCGTQIAEGATICPACSRPAAPVVAGAQSAAGGLTDNVAGMLAYITFIPAIIFLVLAPYNRSRFVRFHSFQSLFFTAAVVALEIILGIFSHMPFVGWMMLMIWPVLGLGLFVLWVVLLVKANQGQLFKLPIIGDLAEKQANLV